MHFAIDISILRDRYGYQKTFDLLAEAGFTCLNMDYFLYNETPAELDLLCDDYLERAYRMRQQLDAMGLRCIQTHGPSGMRRVEGRMPDERELPYLKTARAVEASSILGAENIVLHLMNGWVPDYIPYNRDLMRSFIPYCKPGTRIAIENEYFENPDGTAFDPMQGAANMSAFVRSLESDCFCICVDIGHAAVSSGKAPETYLQQVDSSLLKALHVHDTDLKQDMHVLPYQADHNWTAIMQTLAQMGYTGNFEMEVSGAMRRMPDELMPAFLKMAKQVGDHLVSIFEAAKK